MMCGTLVLCFLHHIYWVRWPVQGTDGAIRPATDTGTARPRDGQGVARPAQPILVAHPAFFEHPQGQATAAALRITRPSLVVAVVLMRVVSLGQCFVPDTVVEGDGFFPPLKRACTERARQGL